MMTKTCKKVLLSILLAISCVVYAGLFVACGGTSDDAVMYTVTVRYDETTPAGGAKVTVGKGGATYDTKTTDKNGKVEFSLSPDDYQITIKADGYSVPADADLTLTKEKRELVVTLVEDFAYKVKLISVDGTPYYAQGVMVGVCTLSGNCLSPVALKEDGTARCKTEKGDYHVKITGLPETVTYEHDAEGYYTGENFSAEKTEMTITVYPVTPVLSATPMTEAEKTAFAAKGFGYTANTATAYHFTKTLKAGETAYYSITPDCDGDYNFYKDTAASYLENGKEFKKGNLGQTIFNILTLKADTTYYFNVSNNTDAQIEAEFVVEAPVASYSQITGAGTVNVTIAKEGSNAVIELTPAMGASFKLTAQGTQKTSIKSYISAYYAENAEHEAGDYKAGDECSEKFTEDRKGTSLYFSVAVKDVTSYPVTFEVKVEKIADLKNKTNEVRATETLSQYPDNADSTKELTAVPFDGTATLVYNETDKFYHLGTADGPVVVVMLTEKSDRFALDGGLVYLEEFNEGLRKIPYVLDVTSDADKADLTKGNTYNDYRIMLRGFGEYDLKPNQMGGNDLVRPTITEQRYYAKFVNSDGVYPLTKELEAFLKVFAQNNVANIIGTPAEGCEWLFACYTYAQEQVADVVVGEYVSTLDYKLTVKANGTYVISEYNMRAQDWTETESGTWKKTGENAYTFTLVIDYGFGDPEIVNYTVTRDAQTGALTWVDTAMDNNEPYGVFEVYVDPVVGNYEQATMGGTVTLTVNADGTFTIAQGRGSNSGTWVKNNDGTYTFTMVIDYQDGSDPVNIVYTVTRNEQTGGLKFHNNEEQDPEYYEYEFEVPAPVETDPVVGNYESVDGDYKLTVNADGTYVIMMFNPRGQSWEEYESGTWKKNNDGTYTFTAVFDFGNGPESSDNSVTRAADGTLTLVDCNDVSTEYTPAAN